MREVIISIRCDLCSTRFTETDEGSNRVLITIYRERREMDVCDECIHGSFLQEARPVKSKAKSRAEDGFPCHCGKSFGTQRGLSAHQTRMAHD